VTTDNTCGKTNGSRGRMVRDRGSIWAIEGVLNYHGTDSFELQWTQFILLLRLQSFEATNLPLFIRRRAAADSLTSMSLGTIFYLLYIKKTEKKAMQQGGSSFVGTCGPAVLSPADNWRSTAHTLTTPPTPSPSGRKPARLG